LDAAQTALAAFEQYDNGATLFMFETADNAAQTPLLATAGRA
jgi:hypothetical protein